MRDNLMIKVNPYRVKGERPKWVYCSRCRNDKFVREMSFVSDTYSECISCTKAKIQQML
jgi:hypothetical protein